MCSFHTCYSCVFTVYLFFSPTVTATSRERAFEKYAKRSRTIIVSCLHSHTHTHPINTAKRGEFVTKIDICFSGCTYSFRVEETDESIYKLFYCGNFEIQNGHDIGSNLVNIPPASHDSKMISKCVCVMCMRHIMFNLKLNQYPATHTSYML